MPGCGGAVLGGQRLDQVMPVVQLDCVGEVALPGRADGRRPVEHKQDAVRLVHPERSAGGRELLANRVQVAVAPTRCRSSNACRSRPTRAHDDLAALPAAPARTARRWRGPLQRADVGSLGMELPEPGRSGRR